VLCITGTDDPCQWDEDYIQKYPFRSNLVEQPRWDIEDESGTRLLV
jgi:hypothetical protein